MTTLAAARDCLSKPTEGVMKAEEANPIPETASEPYLGMFRGSNLGGESGPQRSF